MKALITGSSGFVGKYLAQELLKNGIEPVGADLFGADINIDILKKDEVKDMIKDIMPDYIFHLAGISSVALSWKEPQKTMEVNINGALNILDGARASGKDIKCLMVGSSDEYGKVAPCDCPIKEETPLRPVNPYAISKKAQEELASLYAKAYGMHIVMTRSFNHTGAGQGKGFVMPDFASQISKLKKGEEYNMSVGNLEAQRDFSDVRDVVRAYRLLAQKGKSGEVYNVGSGNAYAVEDILKKMISFSEADIKITVDPEKFRPIELPVIKSDISKLKKDTGFEIMYSIDDTVKAVFDYWKDIDVI